MSQTTTTPATNPVTPGAPTTANPTPIDPVAQPEGLNPAPAHPAPGSATTPAGETGSAGPVQDVDPHGPKDPQTPENVPESKPLNADGRGPTAPGPSAEELQRQPESAVARPLAAKDRPLRPGEPGYAPPARIAPETGVLTHADLGWNPGKDHAMTATGNVPLAMPAPAPVGVENDQGARPSTLGAAAANAQLSAKVGAMMEWIHDFPYEAQGVNAVVVQTFRDIKARQSARGTASALGRTVDPDAVDQAKSTPPSEFFTLRHLAQQLLVVQEIYDSALHSVGSQLGNEDQAKIDQIKGEFQPYADGPTEPPKDDEKDEEKDDKPPAGHDDSKASDSPAPADPGKPGDPPPVAPPCEPEHAPSPVAA